MCLRFVSLLITRIAAGLRLSRREEMWKTAEILILRHQPQRAAALAAATAEAGLGGPGPARCPARRHAESVEPGTAAADYPGLDRALAPSHRPPPLGRPVRVRQDRPASDPAQHSGPGPTAGSREPQLGVPQDPRRTRQSGVEVAASTVWEILRASDIDPGRRQTGLAWSQFLHSQVEAILACDFFTADLLDGTRAYALAVIEHASRRIRIFGITSIPPANGPPSRPTT
jgi:putative transposase